MGGLKTEGPSGKPGTVRFVACLQFLAYYLILLDLQLINFPRACTISREPPSRFPHFLQPWSSVTTFAELAYKCRCHCELHTNESEMDVNYQQLCLRLSHLSVLVEQNSLLKSFVRIVFYISAIRNAFASHKPPNIGLCERFLQISHNLRIINDQINISGEKSRKLDTPAKLFPCISTRLSDNLRTY